MIRRPQVLQPNLAVVLEAGVAHDHAHASVLQRAQRVDAALVVADAQLGLAFHLGLGDDRAQACIPPGEVDARELAHEAATAIAADDPSCAQQATVARLDVDAVVILREARHLAPVLDYHADLAHPRVGDALDVLLPQGEAVAVAGWKIAEVERDVREGGDLHRRALGEEAIDDASLVEDLDRARVQPAGAGTLHLGALATLQNDGLHPGQRQLGRQHHPRRPTTDNHNTMLAGRSYCEASVRNRRDRLSPIGSPPGRRRSS
jgi:hypothetical protein